MGGVREHLGGAESTVELAGETGPEHPLGTEQAGTGWVGDLQEPSPCPPSGSQSGRRDRQAGNNPGCWKAYRREGQLHPGQPPLISLQLRLRGLENSAGLGGLFAKDWPGHSRESTRDPS